LEIEDGTRLGGLCSWEKDMRITERLSMRAGSLRDYAALAEFHYLRHKPAGVKRVAVLEDGEPTVVGRYLGRRGEKTVVGVLVESLPALSCALRNVAVGERYAGWSDRGAAARLLNREVRCISRVVVHPQWRGLGLAVRLVKWALATKTTPITEALAAMGRVHPFFKLAGMREFRRWPLPRDQRLLDAMGSAGLEAWRLADVGGMTGWLGGTELTTEARRTRRSEEGVQTPQRALVAAELRRWAGGRLSVREQLEKARAELLCEPVYYIDGQDSRTA
jgi:GNAT superfamily N-acetyltransferase